MKTKNKLSVMAIILMAIVVVSGCQKHPPTPPPPAPVPATVAIKSYKDLGLTSVTVKFTITPNDYTINEAGLAYSTSDTSSNATKVVAKSSSGTITISLKGLDKDTKYNVWGYIKTEEGTTFSSKQLHIWTYGLMDIDGNGYHTVKIDGRVWTRENLKVTHYNNGDLIPEVKDSVKWYNDKYGARCYYDNNQAKYDSVYGALYNWYVISDPRGIAPKGWHVPTIQEYGDLVLSLGNDIKAGGPMKEAGTKHWKAPNTGATNSSGFTGLPAGARGNSRAQPTVITFVAVNEATGFWSSSRSPMENSAYNFTLSYDDVGADFYSYNDFNGFSIRLVQDK